MTRMKEGTMAAIYEAEGYVVLFSLRVIAPSRLCVKKKSRFTDFNENALKRKSTP